MLYLKHFTKCKSKFSKSPSLEKSGNLQRSLLFSQVSFSSPFASNIDPVTFSSQSLLFSLPILLQYGKFSTPKPRFNEPLFNFCPRLPFFTLSIQIGLTFSLPLSLIFPRNPDPEIDYMCKKQEKAAFVCKIKKVGD